MVEEKKVFDSVMEETRIFEPPIALSREAHVRSLAEYEEIYKRSIEDPEGFWAEKAEQLEWFKKWEHVLEADFTKAATRWFTGGKLNASFNCLDRHLSNGRENEAALIWEGEAEGKTKPPSFGRERPKGTTGFIRTKSFTGKSANLPTS
jgi:acetyl-CoA synthetase